MNDWEILRHQVAIGGTITDASLTPLAGATVRVLSKPANSVQATFDSRRDGTYFFLDLPDGAYTVSVNLGASHAEADATVQRDSQQSIKMVRLDLELDRNVG